MNITNIRDIKINWDKVPITKLQGETGFSYQRSVETENIRIRLVEYSPGYKADHWCCRGHIIHVLEGDVVIEMKEGSNTQVRKGLTLCLGNNEANPHRACTKTGTVLLIVD